MKKTMKTFWAFGLVALMSVPTTVWADNVALTSEPAAVQQAKAIKGNVVDENGEPMVGVTVKIVGSSVSRRVQGMGP